jgi:AraC-like DNA-binding protein
MDTTTGRICLNTDALPERDRFPAFCEGLFRNVVGVDIEHLGDQPFSGAIDIRCAGPVRIANISMPTVRLMRQSRHISDGNDAIVVQLWRQGFGRFAQGISDMRVGTHEGLVIDNAKPATIHTALPSQFWCLTIPRDRVLALAPGAIRSVATTLHASVALRLLFGYLREITPGDLDDAHAAELVCDHLVDLAAFALGGDTPGFAEQPGVRAANRAAVLCAIERRSDDPELSAVTVARALGITPRYVHLLLEATGKSFTHHVLAKRLERAAALLRDPWTRQRKIADIAGEAGFTDLSYFSRAFRRQFGATPRDVRAAASDYRAT